MLDIKLLRKDFDEVKMKLEKRGEDLTGIDQFQELDEKRRAIYGFFYLYHEGEYHVHH
jgi:seryl-tRNA synthetase